MRLINWNLGNLGNQDRSLSASAVIAPPGCALTGVTSTCADDATNTYSTTEVADIYNWSIINDNTNSASFDPAPTTSSTSVNVVAGSSAGSYTVKLVTVRNGITSTDVCEVTTMVTKPDKPAFTIQDATICGSVTTPTITICSPVAGTYTLKQPNQADKTKTYPTDDAVFTGVVPGIGFTLYVTVNGCKSEEAACGDQEQSGNCPNTQSKQTAPTISPTLGKAEAKDLIAYPVPFSESVTVEFKAKKAENYVINLYDLQGHLVRELKAGNAKAGEVFKVEVSGNGMAESMYLVRKVSKSGISTVKLLKKE